MGKFLQRLRSSRKEKNEKLDITPPPTPPLSPYDDFPKQTNISKSVVTSRDQGQFLASMVKTKSESRGYKNERCPTSPSARDSAYSGPPRYDWIDVESAAAIKVQSIYRGNQVRNQLKKEGVITSSMKTSKSDKSWSPFSFCGVGLLWDDDTSSDTYLKKREKKALEEAKKRKYKSRNISNDQIVEAVEVVEEV